MKRRQYRVKYQFPALVSFNGFSTAISIFDFQPVYNAPTIFVYNNLLYNNIEDEICDILRIF